MRTIDADALIERTRAHGQKIAYVDSFIQDIKEAPTVGGWISVKDRLPEEHASIFERFYATEKWDGAMWRRESDSVLVVASFPDGGRRVVDGKTHDGQWNTTVSKILPHVITHWMPMPELPEEDGGE